MISFNRMKIHDSTEEYFILEIDCGDKTYKLLIPRKPIINKERFSYVLDHFHEFVEPSEDFVKVEIDFEKLNL